MKLRHWYLVFCVIDLVLPNAPFWSWLSANGVRPDQFLLDLFANRVSAFFGLDVFVSAVVVCAFVVAEGGRLGLRHRWAPIAATCFVGVSLGLPLFLYQRQAHVDRLSANNARRSHTAWP